MSLIDMHCDTLWKLIDLDKEGDLCRNRCAVSIPFLQQVDSLAQFFACFIQLSAMEGDTLEEKCESGYRHVCEMVGFLKEQADIYSEDIRLARNIADVRDNGRQGRISAVLTVEEGGILNGRIERLNELHAMKICLVTLMWNYENCIGYPNSRDSEKMALGLKPFGFQVVEQMNELGMIIDVSHASDGTFWDIIRHSKKPVVASHSNCRALCGHSRNLTDEMIRALAGRGGVAGLNFYGVFLDGSSESRIDAMVAHLRHMINVGGIDFPAIGTDFDGFDDTDVLEIPDIGQMDLLRDALVKAGFTGRQIDKIWSENVMRVLGE